MARFLRASLFWAASFAFCNGALLQSFSDLPKGSSFDFIVIGGGTAGSVVASRLSENPKFNVLVLEAGPSNEGILQSEIPLLLLQIPTQFSWNYTTTPQPAAGGREIAYPRGFLLGGSSSVNAMYYTRGSSRDFDRFANFTGDSGWSWDNIFPYFLKNEKWVPPADNHNTIGQFDPAFHNLKGTGMTSVSLPGFTQEIDARVLQTSKDLPSEFPFTLDYNDGTPLGLGFLQSTIGNGTRSSSAVAYLTPSVLARSNLQIVLNTRVTRVLQVQSGRGSKSFREVEVSDGSKLVKITAQKEVILSAGAVNTPHVLLHSGIGDKDELKQLNIPSTLNLPSVGKNLSDHPGLGFSYAANSTKTIDSIFNNATLESELIDKWESTHDGPLVTIGVNHIFLSRIPDNSTALQKFPDPSPGGKSPHFELSISNGATFAALQGNFITALIVHLTPASRGSITLQSNNPSDPPLIDPGFLTNGFDTLALKEEVAIVKRFFAAPSWDGYVLEPQGDFANTTTDQALEEFIINNAGTSAHPVGTASMSPKNANFGVVDPDLKVKGAAGLRIVDASIMPFVVAAHPQAAVYVIAERAADFKADWE